MKQGISIFPWNRNFDRLAEESIAILKQPTEGRYEIRDVPVPCRIARICRMKS